VPGGRAVGVITNWLRINDQINKDSLERSFNSADLTLNAAELKGSHHRVYYFGNHFEKK
jgi:hypothetical protein